MNKSNSIMQKIKSRTQEQQKQNAGKQKKSRHINSKIMKRRNSCITKFVIYQYSIQANLTTMKMHILSKNISNDKNNY